MVMEIVLYILGIILLIVLIILGIKGIILVENANNLIVEIHAYLDSFNYFFDMIDRVSTFIYNIPRKIRYANSKVFGNLFKGRGR